MLQVDILAVTLLKQLIKPHQIKDTTTKIKKLNSLLQENCVGYIFGLIDCSKSVTRKMIKDLKPTSIYKIKRKFQLIINSFYQIKFNPQTFIFKTLI